MSNAIQCDAAESTTPSRRTFATTESMVYLWGTNRNPQLVEVFSGSLHGVFGVLKNDDNSCYIPAS
jgi:hypothetical protein